MDKKTCIPLAYIRERIAPIALYIVEALIFLMIAALYGYEGCLLYTSDAADEL